MILGIQNDLLGFDKDSVSENPLSTVQLLIREGMDGKAALLRTANFHDRLVAHLMKKADQTKPAAAVLNYVAAASRWPDAMAQWMLTSPRYKPKA